MAWGHCDTGDQGFGAARILVREQDGATLVRGCAGKSKAVYCSTFAVILGSAMATTKTATLTIRVDPGLKDALRSAAQAEHRSIANMIEVLIREHCERNDIAINHPIKSEQDAER